MSDRSSRHGIGESWQLKGEHCRLALAPWAWTRGLGSHDDKPLHFCWLPQFHLRALKGMVRESGVANPALRVDHRVPIRPNSGRGVAPDTPTSGYPERY